MFLPVSVEHENTLMSPVPILTLKNRRQLFQVPGKYCPGRRVLVLFSKHGSRVGPRAKAALMYLQARWYIVSRFPSRHLQTARYASKKCQ